MPQISNQRIQHLGPRKLGLGPQEIEDQRKIYGLNEILEDSKNKTLEVLKDTLKDPMIWFLLGIGVVFTLLGQLSESIVLFLAIIPLVVMDALLHWRTQSSVTLLRKELSEPVSVFRGDQIQSVDARMLVPGDLVVVRPGGYVPADGIFEMAQELQIDESTLTGESLPIFKKAYSGSLLGTQNIILLPTQNLTAGYAGTRILSGTGHLRVTNTGTETMYGQVLLSVASVKHQQTPLQISIQNLVKLLIGAAGLLCVVLAFVRIVQGHGWLDAVLSSATLAIAAFPEEFPVVFSFFLGVGVYRLAKRRALVRRAVSIENIGRVSVICTDKTGTLTRGLLELSHFEFAPSLDPRELQNLIESAVDPMSNDPIDLALRNRSSSLNLANWTRIKVFPFTEDRKKETVILTLPTGETLAVVKGSPETLLRMTSLSTQEQEEWLKKVSKWAREGSKVLGFSRRRLVSGKLELNHEPNSEFEFCGLLIFKDAVRPEVRPALNYCRSSGIRVLMLTGDHLETALSVARDIGLGGDSPKGISAFDRSEIFNREDLASTANQLRELDLVARCSPLEKLKIVEALKSAGETVAVTGDGVNDVPALKSADIGIAMGERGSTSAKEVASIILMDDNFTTIVGAIQEGRQLFLNLQKSFSYLLMIHVPFVVTAALIPLMGYPLIYLPLHIVWLELIIHPTALFGFQQAADLKAPSSRQRKNFFDRLELVRTLVPSILMTLIMVLLFTQTIGPGGSVSEARTISLVLLIFWSAGSLAVLTSLRTLAAKLIFGITIFSTILVVQWSFLADLLGLSTLQVHHWTSIILWAGFGLSVNWFFQRFFHTLKWLYTPNNNPSRIL
ncbi:MAG: cation-transporting P-type ATPase [Proteobacteria bacterium]|nr:cation-transporting P-type ATPase [Pseudomonadota bacterium]